MATKVDRLVIDRVEPRTARLRMIGTTPLYMNAMTDHAKKTLLIGGTRKTAADKARIKHDPLNEFRGSAYRYRGEETALGFPQTGIKAALCDAAMETGGVTKAKSKRLLFVHSGRVAVYGTPYLKMDVVRSSDINRTPDVRTRCYLPRWACEVEIGFMAPHLNVESVMTLFANAASSSASVTSGNRKAPGITDRSGSRIPKRQTLNTKTCCAKVAPCKRPRCKIQSAPMMRPCGFMIWFWTSKPGGQHETTYKGRTAGDRFRPRRPPRRRVLGRSICG